MPVHRESQRLETGSGFLRTIIIVCRAVGRHRDRIRSSAVVDRQRAFILRNGVVCGVGSTRQRISERIGAAAHEGLRTCDVVGCALSAHEAVAAHRDIRLCVPSQRIAVVLLGCAGGGQSDGALCDLYPAVRHTERHTIVPVRARELIGGQTHHILATV